MPILPAGVTGAITPAGLELSPGSSDWGYAPDYVVLDSNPQMSGNGDLAPFASSSPTGLTPTQVRHAYGVDQIMYGSIAGDGTGQTIAIIDAYDYPTITTDLHAFDQQFGLPDPPSVTKVNETGGSTLPGTDPDPKGDDWEVEEALDVEWSHAMAPGANILLIECSEAADTDLINNAVGYARTVPGVVAVTMSFGRAEESTDTSLNSYFTTPSGHSGITFLASTGDSGEPGSFPAKSPNVVAVGGTTLSVDSAGDYLGETAWSDSGGGISTYQTQPAFQNGVVTQSTTQRTIPDVAFDADPASGVAIYDSYDFGTTTPWISVGGTSLSSPSWAGLIAVADQGKSLGGGGTLDGPSQTLPRLYQMAASNYHDITSGSNGYSAGVGYDLVTGRGSPIVNELLPQLSAAGPYVVSSTPSGSQTTSPGVVDFNFSGTMDPTSFSLSDVDSFTGPGNVNLSSAITGYSWTNSNTTLQVTFTPQPADGNYTMTIGPQILSTAGKAMDQNQDGVTGEVPGDEYSASWAYDTSPLTVVSTSPVNGSSVTLPFTTLTVNFNEAFNPSTVGVNNITLSQGTVTGATVLSSTSAQYTLSGITSEGTLTVTMAAGTLSKASDGLPMLAYSGSFMTDYGIVAMPATTSVAPLGSQIYESTSSGTIGTTTDTDSFTISLDAGQTLTAVVHPTATTLQPTVSIIGPTGTSLGSFTAAAANQDAYVQSVVVATAGTYTIVVGSAGLTTGGYTVEALLNAAVESEEHNGGSDDTNATAQSLDSAFNAVTYSSSMASVVGKLATTATDEYSMTMTAGQNLSVVMGSLSGTGAIALSLYNSSGTLLSTGTATATNVAVEINNYSITTSDVYYLKVTGSGNDYSLTAIKNAAFDLEPNDTQATAEALGTQRVAVGSLGVGTPVAKTITFGENTPGTLNNAVIDGVTFKFQIGGVDSTDATFGESSGPGTTTYISPPCVEGNASGVVTMNLPAASSSFSFSVALSTTTSVTAGATVSLYNGSTLVETAPINTSPHSPYVFSEAFFSYSGTPVTQAVVSFNSSAAARFVMDNVSFASPGSDASDYYSLSLTAGQQITLGTSTPADGSRQFVNTLNPAIDLLNSAGTAVATNDNGAPDGRNALLTYTATTTGTYTVRVYATAGTTGEYILNSGGTLALSVPTDVREGDAASVGTVTSSIAPTNNLTIMLSSSDTNRLTVPASVVLPAGQTAVTFPINVIDDTLLDGLEAVAVSATAIGFQSASGSINVHDNETAILGVTLPATATEGDGTINGTVTSSAAPTRDIVVQLSSNNTSKLTVPSTVTLKAGQTSATFTANLVDNTIIDGTQNATVTASVENWTSGSATVAVADNNDTLAVSIPTTGWEGQTFTNAGTVTIGGTLSSNLTVYLSSGDTTDLTVPNMVTVLAGQTSATFTVTLPPDSAETGTLNIPVQATASGFAAANSAAMAVHDSTVDHLAFDPVSSPETASVPFVATVRAYNIADEVIPTFTGVGTLSASGQSGALPVTPSSLSFTSGVATGTITIGAVDPAAALTISVGTLTVSSNSFTVIPGPITGFQFSAINSPQVSNIPFPETITATDANGYTVPSFDGTATLSGSFGGFISENMLGNTSSTSTVTGAIMGGYSFTPNQTVVAAAVRSFWGSSVSIWNSSGTLLESVAVTGRPGTWTTTTLSTPLTLQGGTSYVVAAYTASGTAYRYTGSYPTFAWGVITASQLGTTNAFPSGTDATYRYMVDLQVNVSSATSVSVSPTSLTFVNGIWTGNVTVPQAETAVRLHINDGAGQTGDSAAFNVNGPPSVAPGVPVLAAASDTGVSSSDDLTDLNNSAGKTLQFTVGSTLAGAIVTIYANGTTIGQATATGAVTVVTTDGVTVLPDATYTITARQTVAPDAQSVDSPGLNITISTTTPAAPNAAPLLDPASDSGVSNSDGITNINTPTLGGFSIPAGDYARFYRNGSLISGLYISGSTFTVPVQPDGTSPYTYAIIDAAGNTTSQSSPLLVTVITAPPPTPAAPVLQASSDSGSSNSDGITNITTPTFNVASTAPYFRVYINAAEVGGNYQSGSSSRCQPRRMAPMLYPSPRWT